MSILTDIKKYFTERLPMYNRQYLRKQNMKKIMSLGRRTPNQEGNLNYVDSVIQTPYDYRLLCIYSLYNPVLRLVHDSIIREVLKPRKNDLFYDIVPRFTKKCKTCGYESDKEESTCPMPQCSGTMRDPEMEHKRIAQAFLDTPNESSEAGDIIKSILRFSLAVDDWYLSVTENPFAIYVEDSRHMRVVADKLGRLGNSEYFCPDCITDAQSHGDPNVMQSACERVYPRSESCPYHPTTELIETCYVWQDGTSIKARFGKDEVIHKTIDSWLPDLYGHSKVVAVLRQIRSITAMDKFNFDLYSSGHLSQILALKDMDEDEAAKIASDVEEEIQKLVEDSETGEVTRKLRTLVIGTKSGVDQVNTMLPSDEMQNLEWWQLWRETVGAIYGVQPVFMGATEQGKTGYHQRMQILVMNDTTLLYQHMIEEAFNDNLFPRMGCNDFVFKFNEIEEKNELADIQILQSKVAAVTAAANAGMTAELTEEGEVKVFGKPEKQDFFNQADSFMMNKPKAPEIESVESPSETATKSKDKKYTVIEHAET